MQLRQSHRKQAKIKLALEGPSGSGKSFSSLLLASGMTEWNKIAVIDTESGSADLYAHLGQYNVLLLQAPFTPEKYIEAIEVCENAGMEVIIIDSLSHTWDCLLEYHSSLQGNSYTSWGKITPRLNSLMQKILQSSSHIICSMRTKQDYILTEKNGKMVPEKIGLKAVMRDGIDYEFTIVFDIDIKHNAVANKDRTGMFMGKPEFIITPDIGKRILDWCNSGATLESVRNDINNALTEDELYTIYHQYPKWRQELTPDLMNRKQFIQSQKVNNSNNNIPIMSNPNNKMNYGNNAIITNQN